MIRANTANEALSGNFQNHPAGTNDVFRADYRNTVHRDALVPLNSGTCGKRDV